MGSAMGYKSVYFAQRNPALGERFRPRWRRHAALAMSMPAVWNMLSRYAQCDPLSDPPAALGVTARYDGIGIGWFRSGEGYEDFQKTDAMEKMRQDELATFGMLVRNFAYHCLEDVLRDDGEGQIKVFSVINRGASAGSGDFAAVLSGGLAADLLAHPELGPKLARLAVCTPTDLGASDSPGRKHDALLELSFHMLDDATAFFGSEAYAQVAAARGGAFVEVERCATRELLLDDIEIYD
jgi:hypothetical protein